MTDHEPAESTGYEPAGRPAARRRARRGAAARSWWTQRSNLVAFLLLSVLVVALALSAWRTGFHSGFWPNFLLNSAGDLIGGMVVLFLIEPIVRQAAALQIRQHPRLDHGWFLRRVGGARTEVRILDTFSNLFERDRDGAVRALRDAAILGVDIRVLLMSPNTDASALREMQLRQTMPGLWINDLIQANIADFRALEAAILAGGNGLPHGRLELRLYTVAAPFALYGWDERAVFAFLPPHSLSDHAPQLEISTQSQVGREAFDQFEAVWADAAPVPQLLPIQVVDEQATRGLLVRFVHLEGTTYLVSKRIDAAIAANPALLIALGDPRTAFEAEPVGPGDPLTDALAKEYYAKYARRPDASFHRLAPESDQSAPTDRPQEHESLPSRALMEWIDGARHAIRLLDTSSTLMAQARPPFARAVEQAMARGVNVRILLLAPTTQAAQERAAEIQDPAFETKIEANIMELRRLATKMQARQIPAERLAVRLYDRLPECSVHEVDGRTIVAFLPFRRRTSRVKHLEIAADTSLGQFADRQFEDKWATARPLEGLRYADLHDGPRLSRLLLRVWEAGGARFLASNRIEGVLARGPRPGADAARDLWLEIEDRPADRFELSAPLEPADPQGAAAAAAFRALFGTEPDAPLRRLDRVGDPPPIALPDDGELAEV